MGLKTTKGITPVYSLGIFLQAIFKDLNLGNTKFTQLGKGIHFSQFCPHFPSIHNPFHLSQLQWLWSKRNGKSASQWWWLVLTAGDPSLPKVLGACGEVSYLYQWPSPRPELEQLHNIYNGMESNMTHISKRKLERHIYPTFLLALCDSFSLHLCHKNNKGASMGHEGRDCFRGNYFDSQKWKPEMKKKTFEKKNGLLIKTLMEWYHHFLNWNGPF